MTQRMSSLGGAKVVVSLRSLWSVSVKGSTAWGLQPAERRSAKIVMYLVLILCFCVWGADMGGSCVVAPQVGTR